MTAGETRPDAEGQRSEETPPAELPSTEAPPAGTPPAAPPAPPVDPARERLALVASALSGADIDDEIAEALGWPADAACAVAIVEGGEDAGVGVAWPEADAVRLVRPPGAVLVVRLGEAGTAPALGRALRDARVRRAGVGTAALTRLAAARDEAETALLCARAGAGDADVAVWEELGAWALVARLWRSAGRPSTPPPLAALLAADDGKALAGEAEAALDAGGTVPDATRERVRELTGLDLATGDDRLAAHLGLRLWRLGRHEPEWR